MGRSDTHETFERSEEVKQGSNRSFGFVFTVVFALIAGHGLWRGVPSWPYWSAAAVVMLLLSIAAPTALAPLNKLWMRLALALSAVMTPVVMAVLFFGSVLPTGFVMRLLGKDPLRLRWHRESDTYWIARTPEGPPPESFTKQF